MKVRIGQAWPWSGALARVLIAGAGVAAFLFTASLFEPGRGRAAEGPAPTSSLLAGGQTADSTIGLHMGTLKGRELSVQVRSTAGGVRYTVIDGMGHVLGKDLSDDEVYRDFPALDPATMLSTPHAGALMMATERE